jgi:hypothetical protein
MAGLGTALALPALAVPPTGEATSTTISTPATAQVTENALTCSLTSFTVSVAGSSNFPTGNVTIMDGSDQLASVPLTASATSPISQATVQLGLTNGSHSLSAVYAGNVDFQTSNSTATPQSVSVSTQCTSAFVVTVNNPTQLSSILNTMTLTPGQAGMGTILVTPMEGYVSTLTSASFVTVSCSGLSDEAVCTFTPESVEILPGQYQAVSSSMVLQTYAQSTTQFAPFDRPGSKHSSPIAWALLLPGVFALGGLSWSVRRRRILGRISLLLLLGVITLVGTTGCNPNYYYEHHGPVPNPPTPAGNYTVTVSAQSNDGVTAITQNTTFTLVVK